MSRIHYQLRALSTILRPQAEHVLDNFTLQLMGIPKQRSTPAYPLPCRRLTHNFNAGVIPVIGLNEPSKHQYTGCIMVARHNHHNNFVAYLMQRFYRVNQHLLGICLRLDEPAVLRLHRTGHCVLLGLSTLNQSPSNSNTIVSGLYGATLIFA